MFMTLISDIQSVKNISTLVFNNDLRWSGVPSGLLFRITPF